MEVPQLTPVTACPQTGGPIGIARYSYDALDNLVCMDCTARVFSSSIGVFLWLSTLHYRHTLLSWERT